jgi:hypothetical protein
MAGPIKQVGPQVQPIPTRDDVTADVNRPKTEGGADLVQAISFAAKLYGSVAGVGGMGGGPLGALTGAGGAGGTGSMDQWSLLKMQQDLQRESQIFNTLSNVSKTEHETRMAAVRNMRA